MLNSLTYNLRAFFVMNSNILFSEFLLTCKSGGDSSFENCQNHSLGNHFINNTVTFLGFEPQAQSSCLGLHL